jgi:hypothetical protein
VLLRTEAEMEVRRTFPVRTKEFAVVKDGNDKEDNSGFKLMFTSALFKIGIDIDVKSALLLIFKVGAVFSAGSEIDANELLVVNDTIPELNKGKVTDAKALLLIKVSAPELSIGKSAELKAAFPLQNISLLVNAGKDNEANKLLLLILKVDEFSTGNAMFVNTGLFNISIFPEMENDGNEQLDN